MDVINLDKLCVNLFKGFSFTGVKVSIFPIGNWRRRYNSAALRRSLWCNQFAVEGCHYLIFKFWKTVSRQESAHSPNVKYIYMKYCASLTDSKANIETLHLHVQNSCQYWASVCWHADQNVWSICRICLRHGRRRWMATEANWLKGWMCRLVDFWLNLKTKK